MISFSEPYEVNVRNKRWWLGQGIYIGRPSIFGNPFRSGVDGTREEVVAMYAKWFDEQIKSNVQFQQSILYLLYILETEKKLDLVCWCHPKLCHGDIIAQKLLGVMNEEFE
jgi:hypothetical protein